MEIEYKRKRTLNHRAERACGYRSNLLMMDIKYDFKANPFKEKDGKPVLYPAVVSGEGNDYYRSHSEGVVQA